MKRKLWILTVILVLLGIAGCSDHKETLPATAGVTVDVETIPAQPTDMQIADIPVIPPVSYPVAVREYPEVPEVWKVIGDEYLQLWASASGADVITWIPPDEKMQLLGWNERYAYVDYQGMRGYALSSRIAPDDQTWLDKRLSTVEVTAVYSYEQMHADMQTLASRYRNFVSVDTIGYSENGLPIPVMVLGDPNASRHVLLQGAMHGREHMTAWLLMAMADCWLEQNLFSENKVCFHIIPMSNPDGVQISQSGELNEKQTAIYNRDRQKGYTYQNAFNYATQWKANALGVDINRNFPSGWYPSMMRQEPSSQRYGGQAPFTAAEAIALRDYTMQYPFDITISYHSSGCVVYYEFGEQKWANKASKALALAVNEITGYDLAGSGGVDGAGYKDWAIDEMQIPSLTVEIGCGESPLTEHEIYSIFARNLFVLPMLMERLQ